MELLLTLFYINIVNVKKQLQCTLYSLLNGLCTPSFKNWFHTSIYYINHTKKNCVNNYIPVTLMVGKPVLWHWQKMCESNSLHTKKRYIQIHIRRTVRTCIINNNDSFIGFRDFSQRLSLWRICVSTLVWQFLLNDSELCKADLN